MEYDHHIIPNNFCIGYYCIFGMGKRKIEGSTEPNKISRLSSFGFTSSKAASLLNSDHADSMSETPCSPPKNVANFWSHGKLIGLG